MRIRGAGSRDSKTIDAFYTKYNFNIEPKHIESIVVVEDDNGTIIGIGSLVKILEGAFLLDESRSKKDRIQAMKLLLQQADIETNSLGYNSFHSFATRLNVLELLRRKFHFKSCIGSPLIKWVK